MAEQQSETETLQCHWHPAVATRLWCSQCRRAICTDCMVQVPVGIRCRECGRAQPLPTFDVRPPNYIRAFATAIGVTIAGVILWVMLDAFIGEAGGSIWLGMLMPVAIGYVAGVLISRAVNLKRGIILTFVAGATVVISVLIALPLGLASVWTLMATVIGVILATQRVRI